METAIQTDSSVEFFGQSTLDEYERQRIVEKERCKRLFSYFVRKAWSEVEQKDLVWGYHMQVLCDHMQAMTPQGGDKIKKLLINAPPRHTKSLIICVFFPAWVMTWDPTSRFLYGSYSLPLAVRDSVKTRDLVTSDWYQERWPMGLSTTQNSKENWQTAAKGFRRSVATKSTLTGLGAEYVIVDDPHNVSQAESSVELQNTYLWFSESLPSRINNPREARFIVAGQRVGENDLSGKIIADHPDYLRLCLPAIKEEDHPFPSNTGWIDPRQPGEALWPEMWGVEELGYLKGYAANAQLQQRPTPRGGAGFKSQWFRYWTYNHRGDGIILISNDESQDLHFRPKDCHIIMTLDTAPTTKESSSYTAIGVWMVHKKTWISFLCAVDRFKEYDDGIIGRFHNLRALWNPTIVATEYKANGISIAHTLRSRGYPIRTITCPLDKWDRSTEARERYRSGQFAHYCEKGEHGIIHRPEWVRAYEAELMSFNQEGTHAHDDQVDITSHLANLVRQFAAGKPNQAPTGRHPKHVEKAEYNVLSGAKQHHNAKGPSVVRQSGGKGFHVVGRRSL